ncbi:MAG TPA: transcriptional regulator [Phycisphaerales bacterium]|nr:transcriptional regulator [Phycisphaerales bacterium]
MNTATAEHVAEVLKAIANPVRLQIIEALEHQELCVGDICQAIGVRQAIASQQLTLMKDKGVLASRRSGAKVYYRVENPNVTRVLHCIYNHYEDKQEASHAQE